MTRWQVHLTVRDDRGARSRELVGTYLPSELPDALQSALRRARASGAGVQVVRDRPRLVRAGRSPQPA